MKFPLLLAIFAAVSQLGNAANCPNFGTNLPSGGVDKSARFPNGEAGLQIFGGMRIPCDGVLTEWNFKPRMPYILQLHLAVFRQTSEAMFKLVGQNYVEVWKVPDNRDEFGWVVATADPPIPVETGDYVGLFYDNFTTSSELVPIPSRPVLPEEQGPSNMALVWTLGNLELEMQRGYIHRNTSRRHYRIPALSATVKSVRASLQRNQVDGAANYDVTGDIVHAPPVARPASVLPATLPPPTFPPPTQPLPTFPPPSPRTLPPISPPVVTVNVNVNSDVRCRAVPVSRLFCAEKSYRSFYDAQAGVCREYMGCPGVQGNENNFDSATECRNVCGVKEMNPSGNFFINFLLVFIFSYFNFKVCETHPTALETCYVRSTRYFYNPYDQVCQTFYGCSLGGRPGNNFDTIEECNQCRGSGRVQPLPQQQRQYYAPATASPRVYYPQDAGTAWLPSPLAG